MTMLTNTPVPFERTSHSTAKREPAGPGTAEAHLARIKRFCVGALTLLAAGATLAAIMALKIAVYLPRIIHH
jgi:hypothetical protein